MANFIKVATVNELAPGDRKIIDLEDITVALFFLGGKYYCIEDVCTHDGGPVAEGELDGFAISCPRHGALFDLRDGSVLSMPAVVPVQTFQVIVEGEDIYVDSPDDW